MDEFKNEFRCITMDQRNAIGVVASVLCQPVGRRPENPDVTLERAKKPARPDGATGAQLPAGASTREPSAETGG
jgi:hypothetical protein